MIVMKDVLRKMWKGFELIFDLGEIGFGEVDWINMAQDRDR
jgi:hypothetical protein